MLRSRQLPVPAQRKKHRWSVRGSLAVKLCTYSVILSHIQRQGNCKDLKSLFVQDKRRAQT
eukprot:957141-Amphidinium_carterae.1